MFNVWSTEASIWKEGVDLEKVPFHQTRVTREFLDRSDQKFFVCGMKGVGKTLLLRKKSQEVRNSHPGVTFLPKTELVERLTPIVYSMSTADAVDLNSPTGWSRVWQFALALAIAKRRHEQDESAQQVSRDLLRVFPESTSSISYHVDRLLQLGPHERRLLLEKHLPEVVAKLQHTQHAVYVFVDSIDECVYSHAGPDLLDYESRSRTQLGHLSPHIWHSAQVGFVRAAAALHESHRHIKIFGALRKEAFEGRVLPDGQNLEAYLLPLEYTRSDLRDMFTLKLEALRTQDPSCFADPKDPDVLKGFFGFTVLQHPTVTGPDHEPFHEHVIDYIIRHSRGRPRELDMVGQSLQLMTMIPRNVEDVRRRVKEKSRNWYEWAKSEAIPYWTPGYERVLAQLPSNILSGAQLKRHLRAALKSAPLQGRRENDLLLDLFELGLIGCVLSDDDGRRTQRFRQSDPELPVGKQDCLNATHYAVHPCVNLATRAHKTRYVPHAHSVAGHGCDFSEQQPVVHVHFGAGALGLGLVLPLLAASRDASVCVIQRRTSSDSPDKWSIADQWGESCNISVKYRPEGMGVPEERQIATFSTVTALTPLSMKRARVRRWKNGLENVFCLTDDQELVRDIVASASSVSTALRSRDSVVAVAELVRDHGDRVKVVYPFENSEDTFIACRHTLAQRSVLVCRVSADRICVEVERTKKGMRVFVEDYYRLVVNDESAMTKALFAGARGDDRHSTAFTANAAEFEFERQAKRILVNGLHFAYGLIAFKMLKLRLQDRDEVVRSILETPISDILGTSQEIQNKLEQVAELSIVHLVVLGEELGWLTDKAACERAWRDLRARYDVFIDRLTTTRDRLDRLLDKKPSALRERLALYVTPIRELPGRIAGSRGAAELLREAGWDQGKVRQATGEHLFEMSELLTYLRD